MDTAAFDLQEIKKVGQSFYISTFFYSLILAGEIVIYLSSVVIYGYLLKQVAVIAELLQ